MRGILIPFMLLGFINLLRAQTTDFTNCCMAQITSSSSDPCSTFQACCNSAITQYGCEMTSETCSANNGQVFGSCTPQLCSSQPPSCAPPPLPATTTIQPLWPTTHAQPLWAPAATQQSNNKNGAVKKVGQTFLTMTAVMTLCQFLL
jgi:hypothetical protein